MQNWVNYSGFRIGSTRYGWLLLIILIYLCQALWHFDKPIAPDSVTTYLPFAKKVLALDLGFFLQPESIVISPVAYLWPALFGGEVTAVKYANLVSGILMVFLTYGIGRKLHSQTAGLIAAFLFAISPFLVRWIPTALSEPPFFLFTLTWLWGIGEIIAGKKWAIPIAGIALSLSILTRGVWLYPSIIFLTLAFLWIFFKPTVRKTASHLAASLLLGLIIPILVIIKNMVLFGAPTIETGSGAALFLGANLMTNGFEPPLLGLSYESGASGFHSVLGNREHALVAMHFLKERSLPALLDWYITKISWLTLFTALEAPIVASVWRALELAMALTGVWWGFKQRNIFVLLMGIGIVLQIFQTAFAIYNIRYSIDGLELLLTPLAAAGISLTLNIGKETDNEEKYSGAKRIFFKPCKYRVIGAAIAAVLLLVLYCRAVPTISLPPHVPVSILFESTDIGIKNHSSFSVGSKLALKPHIELNVPKQTLPPNGISTIWKIKMAILPVGGGECRRASVKFNPKDPFAPSSARKPDFSEIIAPQKEISYWMTAGKSWFKSMQNKSTETGEVYFNVNDDGVAHTYLLGTAISGAGLFPVEAGRLIIKFDCSSEVRIVVDEIALIAPHFISTYFTEDVQ